MNTPEQNLSEPPLLAIAKFDFMLNIYATTLVGEHIRIVYPVLSSARALFIDVNIIYSPACTMSYYIEYRLHLYIHVNE